MRPDIAQDHLEVIYDALAQDGLLLEFGSGGSTVWFADRLTGGQALVSVEHDQEWWDRVTAATAKNTRVQVWLYKPCCPIGPYGTAARENPTGLADFIAHPSVVEIMQQASVIFIDGAARGACLASAVVQAPPGCSVFLHDAQRPWYEWAVRLCPESRTKLIPPAQGHASSLLRVDL